MTQEILRYIPIEFINFLLTVVFALLIGLEQRRHNIKQEFESLFGTDRTFTLIGIFGYILYALNTQTLVPFLGGGAALAILLGIDYYQKIKEQHRFGMTSLVTGLITYCLGPLTATQPKWLVLSVVVCVLIITEIKDDLLKFSQKFDNAEFITLAKFIVLAGIILPLLPDTPISQTINISPFHFWLAIVVVSSISYVSYLLKKFVFPNAGMLLTGILGGLYSSTATTVILARKSKEDPGSAKIVPAIMLATAMMYVRIYVLAVFFNGAIAASLARSFVVFIVIAIGLAVYFLRAAPSAGKKEITMPVQTHTNPLEFKTAFIFGGLFIIFGIVTGYVITAFGSTGVNMMAFVVGVTDIDPFILNLFQSKWNIADAVIVMAVLNAITSNNLLKLGYTLVLGSPAIRRRVIICFGALVIAGVIFAFV